MNTNFLKNYLKCIEALKEAIETGDYGPVSAAISQQIHQYVDRVCDIIVQNYNRVGWNPKNFFDFVQLIFPLKKYLLSNPIIEESIREKEIGRAMDVLFATVPEKYKGMRPLLENPRLIVGPQREHIQNYVDMPYDMLKRKIQEEKEILAEGFNAQAAYTLTKLVEVQFARRIKFCKSPEDMKDTYELLHDHLSAIVGPENHPVVIFKDFMLETRQKHFDKKGT